MVKEKYLELNFLHDITKENLTSYWKRKNRLAIVQFDNEKCLVFLVEDKAEPEVPGYPALGIEYFDSHKEAAEAVHKCYERLGYTPDNAEFGCYTSKPRVKKDGAL